MLSDVHCHTRDGHRPGRAKLTVENVKVGLGFFHSKLSSFAIEHSKFTARI
jgi:hypothetical protein